MNFAGMSIFHLPVHLSSVFRVPYTRCTLRKIIHGVRSPLPTLHYAPSNGSWWGVWTRGSMFEKQGVIFYNSITSQRMYNKRQEPGYQVYRLRLLSFLIICCLFSNKIADKQLTFTSFKHTMNWKISKGASCCAWPKNTVSKAVMCCRRRYILPAASSCPQRWVISSPELRLRRSLVLNIISVIYPTLNLTEGTARCFIW